MRSRQLQDVACARSDQGLRRTIGGVIGSVIGGVTGHLIAVKVYPGPAPSATATTAPTLSFDGAYLTKMLIVIAGFSALSSGVGAYVAGRKPQCEQP